MLPSCGHFKNIPCPFYKLALCVRPHCPYKHQNSENGSQRQLLPPLVDETESLFESKVNVLLDKSPYTSAPATEEKATYIPTPVETNSKPPGILKSSSNVDRPSTSFVPEYKPTPISQLKEIGSVPPVKSSKSQYSPEYPTTVRKKKNVEEYDPTEVKCIAKKCVTFVDQSDFTTDDSEVITISSEEEDAENAPKFSDDEFEEETSTLRVVTEQVPTIKEEKVDDEVIIDEFSVVDKILVDCKKNERLLNSFKNVTLPSKTNNLPSKNVAAQKNDKIVPQKSDIKTTTKSISNCDISLVKIEKDLLSNKGDDKNSSKFKSKKDEISDFAKVKKSDKKETKTEKSDKKEIKTEKNEVFSEKAKKISSSHSSHSKVKHKDSKDSNSSKHSKKTSHENKKHSSSDGKSLKSDKHSSVESPDKIKKSRDDKVKKHTDDRIKKSTENHHSKHSSSDTSDKKNSKSENISDNAKRLGSSFKIPKYSSSSHGAKRKNDVSDSDSEHHSSKNKSSDGKKFKSDDNALPSKKKKSDNTADRTKSQSDDNATSSDIDESLLNEFLSSSDDDPDEECRRIFNEYYPEDADSPKDSNKNEETAKPRSSDSSDIVIYRKKRYAHPGAADLKPPTKQAKVEVKRPLNPAQVMHNRFAQCQAKFSQMNENKDSSKGGDKKRINFVPNPNLLAAIKNKNEDSSDISNFSPLPPTVSRTLKVTKRTAHIPDAATKPRPIIPTEYGSKVPANLRQKYLNAFIDECLKFCLSEDEAYDQALEEEKNVYQRSSSRALYLNVAANALKRLRRKAEDGPTASSDKSAPSKSAPPKPDQRTVSHETVLNGPLAQRRSFSVGPKKAVLEVKDLGGAALYEYLLTYVLTAEQLKENSYPLPHPTEKDRAVISGAYANRTLYCNDAFKRLCSRCHKTYYVNVEGDYVRDEECDFHWGRIWKKRIAGNFESRYSCCQGDAESDGCCVSPGHVFEGSEAHVLKGFVKTLPKTPPRDNNYGIYALDCEMCYTTAGMELTRITVVDTDCKPVFESFVKPQNKVLDYNTRFSGITEDDLKNVHVSIQDVQAVLLCIFNNRSILIGHSLESDFKALKLFHGTVVDTSVVFPHKNGPPFKRALKTLMAEKLNKIIQNDVGGHDSNEDAVACMELMLWKIKEDIRSNR